jgi:hypothetical protein
MDIRIFKNSYVIFIITFILLCAIFYFFEIAAIPVAKNGVIQKKFNWKYPLAISLVVWVAWHFYLYPPPEEIDNKPVCNNVPKTNITVPNKLFFGGSPLDMQRINMMNWT